MLGEELLAARQARRNPHPPTHSHAHTHTHNIEPLLVKTNQFSILLQIAQERLIRRNFFAGQHLGMQGQESCSLSLAALLQGAPKPARKGASAVRVCRAAGIPQRPQEPQPGRRKDEKQRSWLAWGMGSFLRRLNFNTSQPQKFVLGRLLLMDSGFYESLPCAGASDIKVSS